MFWGWGGEDDDMSKRISHHKMKIIRYQNSKRQRQRDKTNKDKKTKTKRQIPKDKDNQPPQDEDDQVPEQHRPVQDDQAQAGEGKQDASVLLELKPQEVRARRFSGM